MKNVFEDENAQFMKILSHETELMIFSKDSSRNKFKFKLQIQFQYFKYPLCLSLSSVKKGTVQPRKDV